VSSAVENRAAVFTSQPQAVEVYQSGAWWPGELLGWRHDAVGGCQVWVRVILGGLEESAWTDLTSLRLPERPLGEAPEATPRRGPATQEMAATRVTPVATPSTPARDLSETASLPRLRDRSVSPSRATSGTRPAVGRRRAPDNDSSTPRTAPNAGAAGRHRAPADPGRHRAADTGLLPAVTLGGQDGVTTQRPAVGEGRTIPSPRSGRAADSRGSVPGDVWSASGDPEPELLTRPMRLSDLGPGSRRPRLDGSLAGV
jgi:hypothetical protein